MPYPEVFHGTHVSDAFRNRKEAFREFVFVWLQGFQFLAFHVQPSVIDQEPFHRNVLITQLLCLFFQSLCIDLLIEGIPAAPAEVFQHLRHCSFFSKRQLFDFRHGLHCLVHSMRGTCVFRDDKDRLIEIFRCIDTGEHDELHLCIRTRCQLCLVCIRNHRKQAVTFLFRLNHQKLCSCRNLIERCNECRSCPPVIQHIHGCHPDGFDLCFKKKRERLFQIDLHIVQTFCLQTEYTAFFAGLFIQAESVIVLTERTVFLFNDVSDIFDFHMITQ